jgi:hypothetical protein
MVVSESGAACAALADDRHTAGNTRRWRSGGSGDDTVAPESTVGVREAREPLDPSSVDVAGRPRRSPGRPMLGCSDLPRPYIKVSWVVPRHERRSRGSHAPRGRGSPLQGPRGPCRGSRFGPPRRSANSPPPRRRRLFASSVTAVSSRATSPSTPPPRPTGHITQPVDPGNGPDHGAIIRHAGAVELSTHRVSERYSAGQYGHPTSHAVHRRLGV